MPELPEVEVARRAVQDHCVGKKIVRAIIADDKVVIEGEITPAEFEAKILDKTIVAAHRKGKNMWLELDSPPFPTFQFGMTGAVYIKGVAVTQYKRSAVNDADEWPSKYSKFFVELDDGLELSFTDKRRFARVRLLEDPTSAPPISELGPDALLNPFTAEEFFNSLRVKKIGIKALLLDQSFISGIGNWIADEVLYQANIHPLQSASTLSEERCATLVSCIKEVIEKAVEVGADNSQFPSNWLFHSRDKKPGKAFVDGKKIDFIKAGGRTTAYVPELQKLTGAQASKASATKGGKQASKGDEDEAAALGDNDGGDRTPDEKDDRKRKSKPQNNKKSSVKNPSRRKKSVKTNADDDNSDEEDSQTEEQKDEKPKPQSNKKGGVKKPSTRKTAVKDDDGINDGHSDEEDSGNDNKNKKAAPKRKAGQDIEKEGTKSKKATGGNKKTTATAKSKVAALSVTEGGDDDDKKKGNPKGARQATTTNTVRRSGRR